MNISTALFQELVAFLTPLPCFENERARKTLLLYSGLGELLPHIECAGRSKEFVTLAIHQLAKYGDIAGEPALLMFLRGVANEVGTDNQAMLQDFEERLKSEQPARCIFPPKDNPPRQTPPVRSFSRSTISMLGLILMIAVAAGFGRFWPDIEPFLKKPPTPTPTVTPPPKATPTPEPKPSPIKTIPVAMPKPTTKPTATPEPTPTRKPSCWESETPGATCKEETTGMEFVYVPGGCFQMGSPKSESGRYDNEGPVHEVCLKGFWMGKYEVTQAQWQVVMGKNPSYFKGADRPVEMVSWNDAQAFLKKLNAAVETRGRASLQFRLPSEAEWEYAARAGTQTAYSFGDDPARLGDYAWFDDNSDKETHPVGQKKPNAFGLYDMHGNVWEWCQDTYGDYNETPKDGSAYGSLGDEKAKVLRGGSWGVNPLNCRSANRDRNVPDDRNFLIGARVVVGAW